MDDLQNITANGETICKEMKVNKKETMEKEEEDRRREAAMASSSCLRPNFNPKGITQDQLSKFRVGTLFNSIHFSFVSTSPTFKKLINFRFFQHSETWVCTVLLLCLLGVLSC